MKWGHLEEIESQKKLLYWVLMHMLPTYDDRPIDRWLKDIFVSGGGLSGDPGWEIEHISEKSDYDVYRVWADPEMSGIEPAETIYSAEVVRHAIWESLLALSETYPNKAKEVQEIIFRYNLCAKDGNHSPVGWVEL
ncbi:MAG: hypothetical protein LBE78_08925 [Burkholderiaceae bacterium]|jgi:hypothetical protein|nr:hypothetical protein [Burkholderiaceae bacterium]